MHIVVAGGSGKLGGVVVEHLLSLGHQVTNVDSRPVPDGGLGAGARFLRIDPSSLGQVVEEAMAAQFCRWDPGLSMVGLRFSNVMRVEDYAAFPAYTADERRFNLWSYIDARDGAQAVRKALEAPLTGAEVFIIASPDTVLSRPITELVAEFYPGVPWRRELGPHESAFSIGKARRLLGYDPQHSWRDEV